MNQLEQLLNSLIKIWWKPWNVDVNCDISIKIENNRIKIYFELKTWVIVSNSGGMSLRELVSLESWLWQFCMEKWLYKKDNGLIERYPDANKDDHSFHYSGGYQYRLLESALVPEEELAQFLIDNIKTE